MKKKILLTIGGMVIVVAGIIGMAAYEAHVINVTAHIENALKVTPNAPIAFGTVFPQENFERRLFVTTSESFCQPTQRRVLNIDYKIVQKPKCICNNQPIGDGFAAAAVDPCPQGQYAPVDYATHLCPAGYHEMPLLCPYLSKMPVYQDPAPYTDSGVPAFHDLNAVATGTINKDHDLLDEWKIDLAVPCFDGYCAQDYDEFVHSYNPQADPHDFEAPGNPEGTDFGCDFWFEVTNIY